MTGGPTGEAFEVDQRRVSLDHSQEPVEGNPHVVQGTGRGPRSEGQAEAIA